MPTDREYERILKDTVSRITSEELDMIKWSRETSNPIKWTPTMKAWRILNDYAKKQSSSSSG